MGNIARWAAVLLPISVACSEGAVERSGEAARDPIGTSRAPLQGPNGIDADLVTDSQWGQGYCVRVIVSNQHPSATTGSWSVQLDLGASTTFTTWDATFSGNTGVVTVTPHPHNTAIAPGGSTQFGVCASIPTPGILPVLLSVTSDLPPVSAVTIAEYKLPPVLDPEINPEFPIELWASLYRPQTLETGRQYPLLVLLHGNHGTCGTGSNPRNDNNVQYSTTGTCPPNFIVVPNHRGFDYLGEDLASRGYFVISINTNRGINGVSGPAGDPLLLRGRARLLLRHLAQLSRWDSGADPTPPELGVSLVDRLDFGQVGLLGHSRGGESVRIAYNEYLASGSPWPARIGAPVSFRGIFEIGPTDEPLNGAVVNAPGTPWNVLLPACDWDLRDLDGTRPFDRMLNIPELVPHFKSFYHVWGANHNYYNSEWQVADAGGGGTITGCINHTPLFNPAEFGSPAQRETARFAVGEFFTANVGVDRDETANALFDPAFPLPVPNRVNRGYHPGGDDTESLVLEDFINPTGTSTYGLPNQTGGTISVEHSDFTVTPHDPSLSVAFVQNVVASSSTFFQSNWAPVGAGFDLTGYDFLDIRVDRSTSTAPETPVDFQVQLVNANDTRSSSVSIDDFVDILPAPRIDSGRTLQTARIPLSLFGGAQLASIRAVRLTFDTPFEQGILLANIRATLATTPVSFAAAFGAASPGAASRSGSSGASATTLAIPPVTAGNTIQSVRSRGPDAVAITLTSRTFFEPRAKNLVLTAGAEQSSEARHPNGDLYTVQFLLSRAAFNRLAAHAPLRVDYGPSSPVVWDFGSLDKSALDR